MGQHLCLTGPVQCRSVIPQEPGVVLWSQINLTGRQAERQPLKGKVKKRERRRRKGEQLLALIHSRRGMLNQCWASDNTEASHTILFHPALSSLLPKHVVMFCQKIFIFSWIGVQFSQRSNVVCIYLIQTLIHTHYAHHQVCYFTNSYSTYW